MKSKYSIGFLSCCACLIIAMTFAYQFSYQKAKARAEKLKIEEQQTMENEDSSSVTTGSKASKNDCYYLMEVNGYIVVYFSGYLRGLFCHSGQCVADAAGNRRHTGAGGGPGA